MYQNLLEKFYFTPQKQALYIAFGAAIIPQLSEGVDATRWKVQPEKVDENFRITRKRLKSVLLLPLGYRNSEKDWLEKLEK